MDPDASATEEQLPDLRGIALADLLGACDSALDRAVERVLHQTEDTAENYAAFGNTP